MQLKGNTPSFITHNYETLMQLAAVLSLREITLFSGDADVFLSFWCILGEKVAVSQHRKCEVNKMCYIAFKRQEKSKHLSLWWHSNHPFSANDLIFHSVTKSENLDDPWNKYLLHMQGRCPIFPKLTFHPPHSPMFNQLFSLLVASFVLLWCYVLAVAQSCGSSSHTKVIGSIPDSCAHRVRMSCQKSQQQISAETVFVASLVLLVKAELQFWEVSFWLLLLLLPFSLQIKLSFHTSLGLFVLHRSSEMPW